jgi:hypothetical protein
MRRIKCIALLAVSLMLFSCQSPSSNAQGALHRVGRLGVGAAYDVYGEGGYAYVTNNDGAVIVDIHRPRRPRKVGTISIGEAAFGVFVQDELAYVVGGGNGVIIADVSDPANPKRLGVHRDGGVAWQIRVDGSYAYVADGPDGLEVLDVSDPSNPLEVANLDDGGVAVGIEVENSIVYLADARHGVEVIDVADPRAPRKIKTVPGTEGAWDVYVYGDLLYVASHGRGVKIVNTAGDTRFQVIGSYHDGDGEELGVWGDGKYLYVADNRSVEVMDVSDPAAPYEVGQLGGPRLSLFPAVHDVVSDGEFIYLADGWGGLIIVEFRRDQ